MLSPTRSFTPRGGGASAGLQRPGSWNRPSYYGRWQGDDCGHNNLGLRPTRHLDSRAQRNPMSRRGMWAMKIPFDKVPSMVDCAAETQGRNLGKRMPLLSARKPSLRQMPL
jgi:hypothetical protein